MKRKNDTFSQVIVGFFMVAVVLMLGYFTIVISGTDVFSGRNRIPVRIAFDQVGGLKDRDNVMYRGTKVGIVDRVEVTATNLIVVVDIDEAVVLRTGYCITVRNLSMLGGNYLCLEEGLGTPLDLTTTIFRGQTPTDWMQDVSKIAKNLKEFTSRPEINSIVTNVEAASGQVRQFMEKANAVANKADALMARIERGEGTAGKLLSSDDTVYTDLKSTLANAKSISEKLNREKMYDDLAAGIAAFRKAAEGVDVKETVAKANNLLDQLNAVSTDIKSGKGSLGKLAQDPALYNELDGLIRDCRQVIDNFRDTTPISTFSSLAVGAF